VVRVLVTADWQLGKAFSGVGLGSNRFREQLFLTAEHIIKEMSPDFDIILILGDTFDRPDADWKLIERVADLLRSCDKPIHIIPGNHDFWHTGGVLWALNNQLEDATNVVIHSEQQPFRIESLGITIYPGVLKQRMDLSDRTSWIPGRTDDDGLRIGMFHESIQPHGTFDPDVAANHDLDLALLGDWHGPSGDIENSLINQPERKLWYAGSHEPQNISHNWRGRVLSIDVEIGQVPDVNPIEVGSLQFTHIEFEFQEDMDEPLNLLNDRMEEIDGDSELTFIRLNLTGEASPAILEALDEQLLVLTESWPYIKVEKDDLSVIIDPANDDLNLREIERELENMNLQPSIMNRAILLLRRYHRRLA